MERMAKPYGFKNSFAYPVVLGHGLGNMSIISTESSVMEKTRELCEAIVADAAFQTMHADVETFLGDDSAREAYKSVHEKGAELQDKQRIGVELTAQEMTDFELAREELLQNQTVTAFMQAQQELQMLQKQVNDQWRMLRRIRRRRRRWLRMLIPPSNLY